MPYSKEFKFIQVAIPKTGTTSLVHALKTIDPNIALLKDLVTEEYREKYNLNKTEDLKPGREKHLSALQIKYILGDEVFNSCFKFSIVRNPWARCVTRYFYTHTDNEPSQDEKLRRGTTRKFHDLDFDAWIRKFAKSGQRHQKSQLKKLVDLEGNLLVDYVGRLENFQESFDYICDQIGCERRQIPHSNSSGKRPHYSQYYTPETQALVAEACIDDIEYFGFKFETS